MVHTSSLRYFFRSTEKVSRGVSKASITVRGSTVETVPFSFDVHSLTALTRASFSMIADFRFWLWTWSRILSTQACLCIILGFRMVLPVAMPWKEDIDVFVALPILIWNWSQQAGKILACFNSYCQSRELEGRLDL